MLASLSEALRFGADAAQKYNFVLSCARECTHSLLMSVPGWSWLGRQPTLEQAYGRQG